MARLTRNENQARTREKLVAAARELFARNGYGATSVERIAEQAGFSKGAVYSNFETKEAIFLAALESQSQENADSMLDRLKAAPSRQAVLDILADWADERSRSGNWTLTILEHARAAGTGSASLARQSAIIEGQWSRAGAYLTQRFPEMNVEPATLGALLHEIAYAPALSLIAVPTAGDVMRLALGALIPR